MDKKRAAFLKLPWFDYSHSTVVDSPDKITKPFPTWGYAAILGGCVIIYAILALLWLKN